MSDTHGLHTSVRVPDGDVIIHAGDFSNSGSEGDSVRFGKWWRSLPHSYKVVVAGNHDWFFSRQPTRAIECLGDSIYLQDSATEFAGLRFWGSPWQPRFGGWAFNLSRGEQLRAKWDLIPVGTDILITHGPPRGVLDSVRPGERKTKWGSFFVEGTQPLGCTDLASRIVVIRPRLHVFGHIHDGYGELERDGVRYINASICDELYRPVNPVVVIDL